MRRDHRPLRSALFICMVVLAGIVLYPIFFALNSAFKNPVTFAHDRLAPAIPPKFDSLLRVAEFIDLPQSLAISLVVSSATALTVWVVAGLAAYGFTKTRLPFRNVILVFVLAGMFVPIQVILSPIFLVLREIRLINTLPGLILTEVAFTLPLATFLFAAYLRRIPTEIVEAARVDGASVLKTIFYVLLPLSRPALATVGVITFVNTWNALLIPIIVTQDRNIQPLTLRIAQLRGQFSGDPVELSAGVAISIMPVLIVYLLAQRYLVRAVIEGMSR